MKSKSAIGLEEVASQAIGKQYSSSTEQVEGSLHGPIKSVFLRKGSIPSSSNFPVMASQEGEGEEEIERYAEHVHSFLKVLGLEKIFLAGHSMGGAIVQAMALSHPEMIKGIVLVGTGARLKVFPMILTNQGFEDGGSSQRRPYGDGGVPGRL